MLTPSSASRDAFWAWWPTAAPELERSLAGGGRVPDELVGQLDAHVDAIDPRLAWNLGSTTPGQYALTVTAAGEHELYATAARLAAAAPDGTGAWSFFSTVQPHPEAEGLVLQLAGREIRVADARFGLHERPDDQLLDVTVDHPASRGLDPDAAAAVAFGLLDALVGEAAVERHLGVIEPGRARLRKVSAEALRGTVRRMQETRDAGRAEGVSLWAFLDSGRDGLPGVVSVNSSLRHIDHPLFDARGELELALLAPTPAGLTCDAEADLLAGIQEKLLAKAGARAVHTSRETHAGRRTIQLAFDGEGPIGPWLEQLPESWQVRWEMVARVLPDPAWEHARDLIAMTRTGK